MIVVLLTLISVISLAVTAISWNYQCPVNSIYKRRRLERCRLKRELVIVNNRYAKMKKHYATLRRKHTIVHSRYKRAKTKLYELVELHFGQEFIANVIEKPTQQFIVNSASRESSPSTASTGSNDSID
jgi:hypothetical protein